jgi:hypothetical protein
MPGEHRGRPEGCEARVQPAAEGVVRGRCWRSYWEWWRCSPSRPRWASSAGQHQRDRAATGTARARRHGRCGRLERRHGRGGARHRPRRRGDPQRGELRPVAPPTPLHRRRARADLGDQPPGPLPTDSRAQQPACGRTPPEGRHRGQQGSDHNARIRIRFDSLDGTGWYSPTRAYYHSKLAQIMFSLELASRTAGQVESPGDSDSSGVSVKVVEDRVCGIGAHQRFRVFDPLVSTSASSWSMSHWMLRWH